MPSATGAIKYGSKGAGIGYGIAGPVGAGVGGGIGMLAGLLFGGDDDDERNENFQEYMNILTNARRKTVADTSKTFSGVTANATSDARRRAGAAGRQSNAEDYILPAEGQGMRAYAEALRKAVAPFDEEFLSANREFAGRPIEPNALDYLSEAGDAVSDIFQNEKLLNATKESDPEPTGSIPSDARSVTAQTGLINDEMKNLVENFDDTHDEMVTEGLVNTKRKRGIGKATNYTADVFGPATKRSYA